MDIINYAKIKKLEAKIVEGKTFGESVDVSGNPALVRGALEGSVMIVETNAPLHTQLGTGDASPDNARPIVGIDSVTFTIKGDLTETYTVTPSKALYGFEGQQDTVRSDGVITLNTKSWAIQGPGSGELGWSTAYGWNDTNPNFVMSRNMGFGVNTAICSHFKKISSIGATSDAGLFSCEGNRVKFSIEKNRIGNPTSNLEAQIKLGEWFRSQDPPVQFVYVPQEPEIENVEPANIIAMENCEVSADTGNPCYVHYKVPLYQLSTIRKLFTNATTDGDSEIYQVATSEYAYITAPKMVRARMKIYGSVDATNWNLLPVRNVLTDTVQDTIYHAGTFMVPVVGYKYIKASSIMDTLNATLYAGRGVTAELRLTRNNPVNAIRPSVTRIAREPITLSPESSINAVGATTTQGFLAGATENTIYAFNGGNVRVSVDGGATFSSLFTLPDSQGVKQIAYLGDDTLLVFSSEGKTYKTNTDKNTPTLVHTFTSTGTAVSYTFGVHAYDNIILTNEYGGQTGANNARHSYISTDYGVTWADLFEGRLGTNYYFHLHDVHFDPYSGIIWITNGDTAANSNIWWSPDMGETWNSVWEYGSCPKQFTSIAALPNCVLFLTDSVDVAVWKWNRLTNPPINGIKLEVEPAYIVYDAYPGNEPIGVRAGVTYGANAVAYFAWQFYNADAIHMPARIFATTDGKNYHTIWQANESPAQLGVCNISLTVNGDLLATYRTADRYNLLKIANPGWA